MMRRNDNLAGERTSIVEAESGSFDLQLQALLRPFRAGTQANLEGRRPVWSHIFWEDREVRCNPPTERRLVC